MSESDKQTPQQEAASEEAAPKVIHVNLEDDEVKCDDKQEEKSDNKGKKSSKAWDFFEIIKGCPAGSEKVKCILCNVVIACNTSRNGTSGMMNHLGTVCPKSPLRNNLDKMQKTLQFETLSKDDKLHTLKAHTFNQERLRKKVALMCIKDNQPFRIMEHEGFRELLYEAEPKFKMPSRWTVARDCLNIYSKKLVKLKKCLVSERVSFTTDTWTSIQNINYMCLTAHWINKDWKICKRILNFRQIGSHKGDAIGMMLVELFAQWGIDRIFTITLDNASSNDTAISHLKKFLRGPEAILENKFLHMRCCAHILNLVVKDGLKEQHESITRIRNAVRYVRSSPARLDKFRKCVEREKIKCDRMVCLDVDTRWNSTYTMLDVAVKYKGAFIRMITEDSSYEAFLRVDSLGVSSNNGQKKKKKIVEGAPFFVDFDNVIRFIQFLEIFYDVTLKLSGSKYCTSNVFFVELVKVQEAIVRLCSSEDMLMRDMANRMRDKYNKYWDNMDNTNFLLYVAVVLDPRYKMSYMEFCFAKIYGRGSTKSFMMYEKVLKTLQELFEYYKNQKGQADSSFTSNTKRPDDSWEDDFEKFMEDRDSGGKSELDVYLADERERKSEGFDILVWWKTQSTRLPILSELAKHVLGMPVSSVASEAAFSTGGRTIDAYRSSLSPKTAEALVCSQDWLRSSVAAITDLRGEPEEYLQFEKLENDELRVVGNLFGKLDIDD